LSFVHGTLFYDTVGDLRFALDPRPEDHEGLCHHGNRPTEKDVRTLNKHLQNIFEEGEQDPEATIRKFRIVRREGNREVGRLIENYSLDAIEKARLLGIDDAP